VTPAGRRKAVEQSPFGPKKRLHEVSKTTIVRCSVYKKKKKRGIGGTYPRGEREQGGNTAGMLNPPQLNESLSNNRKRVKNNSEKEGYRR